MPWIEQKEEWLPGQKKQKAKKTLSRVYTVTEVAQKLNVSRQTIFKYLALDAPEEAIIPPAAWFRLPSGHIRIRSWIIQKLMNGEL